MPLRHWFSEMALMRCRIQVEVEWLLFLSDQKLIPEMALLSQHSDPDSSAARLRRLYTDFDDGQARQIKKLEATMRHDVKAIEYYICQQLHRLPGIPEKALAKLENFVHFGCTSEDINNLAWALMIRGGRDRVLIPQCLHSEQQLARMAADNASLAMLGRTHGQAASPTTLGKELAVFVDRLRRQRQQLEQCRIMGKFNGVVGNFNAHYVACPELDWLQLSRQFVNGQLGLQWQCLTTQIEPHDWIAELFDAQRRYNNILLDLCRDLWGYISLGYFRQQKIAEEVGSSTMPHKINPIDFENAEGNLGIAGSLFNYMADKLAISRFQRDLSDSTVLRNTGVAFAHTLIAHRSIQRGLKRLRPDKSALNADLENNWEVLGEALQTAMRRFGIEKPYEQIKALTRGKKTDRQQLIDFIKKQQLPDSVVRRLIELTPATYLGLAEQLAMTVADHGDRGDDRS